VEHYGWARHATHDTWHGTSTLHAGELKATNALRTFNASCFCTATIKANLSQCCVYTYTVCLVYINKLPLEFDRELCSKTKGKLTPVQACEDKIPRILNRGTRCRLAVSITFQPPYSLEGLQYGSTGGYKRGKEAHWTFFRFLIAYLF
jgi:hypothetical protein